MDSNKNKKLIFETNLTEVGFANSVRKMIRCPVVLGLIPMTYHKDHIAGTIFHNFIMD